MLNTDKHKRLRHSQEMPQGAAVERLDEVGELLDLLNLILHQGVVRGMVNW
jgi:hypothetical protein